MIKLENLNVSADKPDSYVFDLIEPGSNDLAKGLWSKSNPLVIELYDADGKKFGEMRKDTDGMHVAHLFDRLEVQV